MSHDSRRAPAEQPAVVLVGRLSRQDRRPPSPGPAEEGIGVVSWRLPLTAEQRSSLRGHRLSACGRDLLLQLPRGEALQPGEWLQSDDGRVLVQVEAAAEPVMQVRGDTPLALLQAAYHLGNRHVAMELHSDVLVLLQDSVLADLLHRRGLQVRCLEAPFQPEAGAYAGVGHAHSHGPANLHEHGAGASHVHESDADHAHGPGTAAHSHPHDPRSLGPRNGPADASNRDAGSSLQP